MDLPIIYSTEFHRMRVKAHGDSVFIFFEERSGNTWVVEPEAGAAIPKQHLESLIKALLAFASVQQQGNLAAHLGQVATPPEGDWSGG